MHEADKMSLDGDGDGDNDDPDYASSSPAPDDDPAFDDDLASDATDEEDWAGIGAQALRARSLPFSTTPLPKHLYQPVPIPIILSKASARSRSRGRGTPTSSTFARSIPIHSIPQSAPPVPNLHPLLKGGSTALPSGLGGKEERDAIEALLSLGTM
jgi:hypothetical protein